MQDSLIVSQYQTRIDSLHRDLEIPRDYSRRGFPLHRDCSDLVEVPCGLEGESIRMDPATAPKWEELRFAAAKAGFELKVRSGYRSPEDQASEIRTDLVHESGNMDRVLSRFLAPGYSEHHTGQALDIIVPDCPLPLPEFYEATPAFQWLQENASRFGFTMTYPRDNPQGIIYEPWHWRCNPGQA